MATLYPSQIAYLRSDPNLTLSAVMKFFTLPDGTKDLRLLNDLIFAFSELDDIDSDSEGTHPRQDS